MRLRLYGTWGGRAFSPPVIERRLRAVWRSFTGAGVTADLVGCDARGISALNWRYRRRRGPTDVLTFVYDRPLPRESAAFYCGEIYCAFPVARRQARARHVSLRAELLRLCVHGLAHLAGYDHATPRVFAAMRKKEFEALVQIV